MAPDPILDVADPWPEPVRGTVSVRFLRIKDLAARGPGTTPELCRALQDPSPKVRLAAAKALGEAGDERAIRPLQQALRETFVRGSGKLHIWLGFVSTAASFALFALPPFLLFQQGHGVPSTAQFLSLTGLWGLMVFVGLRRSQSRLAEAISKAMLQVAERYPDPQWRAAAADLDCIATDRVQQSKSAREVARTAKARLMELSREVEALPVPSSIPAEVPQDTLPRPAEERPTLARVLPRVRG